MLPVPRLSFPAWLAVLAWVVAAPAHAQDEAPGPGKVVRDLIEVDAIEVGLVNLDFVVNDKRGEPVHGLSADDFELRLGRKPIPIEFFAEISAAPLAAEGPMDPNGPTFEALPYLVVLVDCQTLDPNQRRLSIEELRGQLPRLLDRSRSVMVASLTRRLRIDQPFTRELDDLERTLAEVALYPTITDASDDRVLARDIERALDPKQAVEDPLIYERAVDEGERLLQAIEAEVAAQRMDSVVAATQMGDLLQALAGTRHRVSMLLYSGGLVSHPAELLVRLWWSKFESITSDLGLGTVEQLLGNQEEVLQVPELVRRAAGSRVSIYAVTPGEGSRARLAGFSSFEGIEVGRAFGGEGRRNLARLAQATGGAASTFGAPAAPLYDTLLEDLGHYYSLAFDARALEADDARIRLRTTRRGLEVRHFERHGRTTTEERLEQTALAALHFDTTSNPLEVAVELGRPTPAKGRSWLLPMTVSVPVARLALLPDAQAHEGRLSVVVAARGEEGSRSKPVYGVVPIRIDNSELMSWLSRRAGYRLQLLVSPGIQKLAIALRDDVGTEVSTLSLEVEVGLE